MNQTQNYNLNQWEEEDKVRRIDFNADNAKIDAALGALAQGKADAAVLNALIQTVAQKAESAAVTALESRMTAAEARAGARLIKKGVPLGAESGTYTVSFDGVDWNQWKTAYLILDVKANTSNISMGWNSVQHQAKAYPGRKLLIFYPFYSGDSPAVGVNFNGELGENFVSLGNVFKSAVLVLHTYNDEKLLPGTTYEFWGEK